MTGRDYRGQVTTAVGISECSILRLEKTAIIYVFHEEPASVYQSPTY
jgi:hypothetical protein